MTSEIDNPMEVDMHYLQQRKNQRICGGNKRSRQCNSNKDRKNYSSNKHQSRYSKQKNNPPQLYDKNINPVRGYCGKAHCTIDCKQHNYKNRSRQTHRLSSNESSKDEVKLDNPTISVIPRFINNQQPIALWDTSSSITAVNHNTANKLDWKMDSITMIQHTDVNNDAATTKLVLFNDIVDVYVIKGLARGTIAGRHLVKRWNASVHATKYLVIITLDNKMYKKICVKLTI
ncbi:hypothetical protein G6F43_001961 [Rhizopus delemar]|nr:hypothetical protein G6F43_001961 [Rhizopus delemar]